MLCSVARTYTGKLVTACRETFVRLLLLAISLGYQVIFPVIGGQCFKIFIGVYASIYWLFTFIVTLLNALYTNTNLGINSGGFTFASIIQVILELIWWFWIFYNTVVVGRLLKAVRFSSVLYLPV